MIDVLELLNFKDKRLKLYHSEKIKEDDKQVNYIYGSISYVPRKCPKCKNQELLKNGIDIVKLQILNICGVKSYLVLEKQRILCQKCNYCFSVMFKDCKKHCRKLKAVSNVIDYQLAKTKNSLNDIANSNEISTSYVQKQVSRYKKNIKVRKDTLPKVIGIDEINGVKTYQGKYNCLIYDIENKRVKDFLVTRRKQYLDDIFRDTNINHWKIKSTVRTYLKYKEYIINSIIYPYSNGVVESANRNIKGLKNNACGYRNFQNFRTRVFMIFNYLPKNNKQQERNRTG